MIIRGALAVIAGAIRSLVIRFVLPAKIIAQREVVVGAVESLTLCLGVGRLGIGKGRVAIAVGRPRDSSHSDYENRGHD